MSWLGEWAERGVRATTAITTFAWLLGSAASAATTVAADYRTGPGDLLHITVFDYPELANDVRVSETGKITFPLIGQVSVDGLSTHDVEALLTKRLADGGFIRQAHISVLVADVQSKRVSVMGQVARPGPYPLQVSKRVRDAIADAGDVISQTGADTATLIRADGSKIPIDILALYQGDASQNPLLEAGDTIYVPKAPQFYITGAVQRPGAYRLERSMTVSQAVSVGGGLTPRGSEHGMRVKRRGADGREQIVHVHSGDLLQPDDVLVVHEGIF